MKTVLQARGFTVVELIVGILAGAVLAITASVMLVWGYRSWTYNRVAVDLQRDATIALETIGRRVREVRRADVAAPAAGTAGSSLTVDWRGAPVSFAVDGGGSLIYTDGGGNPVTLVRGGVASFTVSNGTRAVSVRLVLQGSAPRGGRPESVDVSQITNYRNER